MAEISVQINTKDLPMVKLFVRRMGEVRDFLDESHRFQSSTDGWRFLASTRSMINQALEDLGRGHEA